MFKSSLTALQRKTKVSLVEHCGNSQSCTSHISDQKGGRGRGKGRLKFAPEMALIWLQSSLEAPKRVNCPGDGLK